jgi:hypothetical protein
VPPKTIYVKTADLPLWDRAEKAARAGASLSVSALAADALRLYFAQYGDQGDGLYVQAPDDQAPVAFDADISAILVPATATGTWDLWLDTHTYPAGEPRSAMGPGTVSDMVTQARTHMAGDGRTAGRAWALERATPGELEAICELARTAWVSFGASPEGAGDPWPTLRAEMARHRPPSEPGHPTPEISRDDFTVGFVEEACAVYEQILETDVAT